MIDNVKEDVAQRGGGRGGGRHAQNFVNGGRQPQNFVKKDGNFNDVASVTSSIQSFRARIRDDSSDSDNDSDFENTQALDLLKNTTVSDCQSKYYIVMIKDLGA